MAVKWRYIMEEPDTYAEFSYQGVAMLQCNAKKEHVVNTVYFAAGGPGYNQVTYGIMNDPELEYNLEYCKEHGITMWRTATGGGPVFVGDHNAMVTMMFDIRDYGLKTLEDVIRKSLGGIAEAYGRKFSHQFRYKPVNDFEALGRDGIWRKCSIVGPALVGNAGYIHMGISVKKFPSFIDLNEAMAYVPEKFADKAEETRTAAARATTIEDETGKELSIRDGIEAYKDFLRETFDAELVSGELTEEEKRLKETFRKAFARDEFIFGRNPKYRFGKIPSDVKVGKYTTKLRPPGGGGPLVRTTVLLKENTIYDMSFTGSFHLTPIVPFPEVSTPLHEVERNLKGVPIDEKVILGKIEEILQKPGYSVEKTTPEDLKDCIMHAIEKAT